MDFDSATRRLKQDQAKRLGRRAVGMSQTAQQEAEKRRKQQQRLKLQRERAKKRLEYQEQYLKQSERALGVRSLKEGGLLLQATSIHGQGDKIALPPSVLQRLTEGDFTNNSGSPWTFRVGILNSSYSFPASAAVQDLRPPSDDDMEEDSDVDDEDDTQQAYLEEMKEKYLCYCFCTVVEFTQEEGCVGLPESIANMLLTTSRKSNLPRTRTKDPAASFNPENETPVVDDNDDDEQTPGHIAWGAFDIPTDMIEISMVTLPKGRGCKLMPTSNAIRNGFYNLQDHKLVLEQSLVRTRSTLTLGDTVLTWHRGIKFDLIVQSVTPSKMGAISCINTDIEIDFAENEEMKQEAEAVVAAATTSAPAKPSESKGYSLKDSAPPSSAPAADETSLFTLHTLLPEPDASQREGVCTIQLRGDGVTGKRRFVLDITKVEDLYRFAENTAKQTSIQLVTRFPRRILERSAKPLLDEGIRPGQEMFLIEKM